jgi:hypothetical protein
MSAPNSSQIIWEYLTSTGATNGLYSQTAKRVDEAEYPPKLQNASKQIVYHKSMGGESVEMDWDRSVYVFKSYGGSTEQSDARAVSNALRDRMKAAHSAKVTTGYVVSASYAGGNGPLKDPDQGWWYMVDMFEVITRNVS